MTCLGAIPAVRASRAHRIDRVRSNDPDPSADLSALGIESSTETVYRSVLREGTVSVEGAARAFGVDLPEAEAMLEELRRSGLVNRSAGDGRYAAVDPRVSVRAIADRAEDEISRLRASIPALAAVFEFREELFGRRPPSVRILAGADAVGAAYNRLEHEAVEEFMAFDRPPYVLAPVNPLESTVISRGVRWRAVYAAASLDRPGSWDEIARAIESGEQARITADLPIKLAIADRRSAIVSTVFDAERPEAIVTESAPLVALLCWVFETYWDRAGEIPTRASTELPVDPRGPSADDVVLLAFFAAGAKDELIARELKVSPRTVRRRSQVLLRRLGAANRFQAGAQAVRLGWI